MEVVRPSVEGPLFAKLVAEAEIKVQAFFDAQMDFAKLPDLSH